MIVRARIARAVFCGITWMRYEAHGCPKSEPMTEGISITVYATTSCRNHPKMPPTPEVRTMALGEAIFALEHSSLRWKGASYL